MSDSKHSEKWTKIREQASKTSWNSYWDLPPAPVSLPKKGSAGQTGNWRVYRPVINRNECIFCLQCFMYCPEGVISIDDEQQRVNWDFDYCKGCGVCANVCPKKCIAMEQESK